MESSPFMQRVREGRARVFGGWTTLWGGQALRLDAFDLQKRSWVPFSGWPISREELEHFYDRADRILQLAPASPTKTFAESSGFSLPSSIPPDFTWNARNEVARFAVRTPAVGFGCGSLTGTGLSNTNRVLEAAFDAGVRHFDTARYYGYGEGEGILGRFLRGRRSAVTITTKFGIEPPRRTTALNVGLYFGRRVVGLLPAVRRFLQRGTQSLVKSGGFSVQQAQQSLETSPSE